jgi:hypothetical protein
MEHEAFKNMCGVGKDFFFIHNKLNTKRGYLMHRGSTLENLVLVGTVLQK